MHMNAVALQAWLALYIAAFMLAVLCASLAVIRTALQLRSGTLRIPLTNWRSRLLALPRLWIAWQLNYLSGAPVVIGICVYLACHLGFGRLGNV